MTAAPIYLDHNASTRCDPRVLEAMWPWFAEEFGNASSPHHVYGKRAADAIERAREQVAELLGAKRREIVFTSGATESDNLALKGVMNALPSTGHLITTATEHKAVLETAHHLAGAGHEVTVLPVDEWGRVSPQQVAAAIHERTALVSVMAANNEVGTLQPLAEIGEVCRRHGVLLHSDAAQMAGKLPLNVEECGLDLVSLSAHKMYGPKGIGALWVRRSGRVMVRLAPQLHGGGQERGVRSGTLPVPLIVGFGVACEIARAEMLDEARRVQGLRDLLHDLITARLEGVTLNGHPDERLPNTVNLGFAWVNGQALLMNLRGVAVSSGSACTSADAEPSHVLLALGVDEERAQASLRFGLGRWTTEDEVRRAADEVVAVVGRLRDISPAYALHRAALLRT